MLMKHTFYFSFFNHLSCANVIMKQCHTLIWIMQSIFTCLEKCPAITRNKQIKELLHLELQHPQAHWDATPHIMDLYKWMANWEESCALILDFSRQNCSSSTQGGIRSTKKELNTSFPSRGRMILLAVGSSFAAWWVMLKRPPVVLIHYKQY